MEETRETPASHHDSELRAMQQGSEYNDLPARHITPNQLIAYNMAYWRKAAGYTQEEFAQRLNRGLNTGQWTNASVSAAERSWDGKRIRQFDADLIFSLATSLGLPMTAFWLPPEDDGIKVRYRILMPQEHGFNESMTMWDVLDWVVNTQGFQWQADDEDEDPEDDSGPGPLSVVQQTNERFRDRLDAALTYYRREVVGGGEEITYAEDAWGIPRYELPERDELVIKLARTRQHYEALRQLLGDIGAVQEDLHERLGLAAQEQLRPKEARAAVKRFRAGEEVKAIARSLKKPAWMVEKALIDAREGFLHYSPEERQYVFVSKRAADQAWHQRLKDAGASDEEIARLEKEESP